MFFDILFRIKANICEDSYREVLVYPESCLNSDAAQSAAEKEFT